MSISRFALKLLVSFCPVFPGIAMGSVLTVTIQPYLLTAKSLEVNADYRGMASVPEKSVVTAVLLGDDGKKVVESVKASTDIKNRHTRLWLPCGDKFGQLAGVRTQVLDAQGKVFAEDVQSLRLPPRPKWLDNGIGVTQEPLAPWGPIELSGDTAKVILREIEFGPSGLPAAIRSRGKSLLAKPITLTLGGRDLTWTRHLGTQTPGRIIWTARSRSNGMGLTLKTTLEYDGMIRYDLTLDPGTSPAEVKDLVLHLPYNQAVGEIWRGVVDDTGASRSPDQRAVKVVKKATTIAAFQPQVQVGDMDSGLLWFAEWCRNWQIGSRPCFELTPTGKILDWKVRMIGSEGKTLGEAQTITWGLLPLPVRELDLATYNTTFRHAHPGGAEGWSEEEATCTLEYPTQGNINPEQGSLAFFASFWTHARLVQWGRGENSINLYYADCPYNQRVPELWVTRGDLGLTGEQITGKYERLCNISKLIRPGDTWLPIGLSWKRDGDVVKFEISVLEPQNKLRSVTGQAAWDAWNKALTEGTIRFGGQQSIAVDEVMIAAKALPAETLAGYLAAFPENLDGLTLMDSLDALRLYRGKYITRPAKITSGRGGIAGGRYSGLFIERTEGHTGRAVFLPCGTRDGNEVSRAYGMRMTMPAHEQFTNLAGYYYIEHMPSPVVRAAYRQVQDRGLGVMMYSGFGFNTEADPDLMGLGEELLLIPKTGWGGSVTPCAATPAVDYYLAAWKKNIDYYGVQGVMCDNTVNCRVECKNIGHGCGWYDEKGELHGRWPIFAAREFCKRLRWLWHVYCPQRTGKDGFFSLHAGARHFFAASGFADGLKFGEGWTMGIKFELKEPEQWWTEGWQWRLGVPGDILPKSEAVFSHNWLMMYGLLYAQPFRMFAEFLSPARWQIDPATMKGSMSAPFNPYFSKEGVPKVASPFALWWQLQDDFDTHSAEFHPFWTNNGQVSLNNRKLRTSFYLHPGRDALFVLANFNRNNVDAEMTVSFEKLGLAGKNLRIYDAWTGDDYARVGNAIRVTLPGLQYRLVRVEQ